MPVSSVLVFMTSCFAAEAGQPRRLSYEKVCGPVVDVSVPSVPMGSLTTGNDVAKDVGNVTVTQTPLIGQNGSVAQSCSDKPRAASYHIHIMCWASDREHTAGALALRERFIDYFNIRDHECSQCHETSSGLAVNLSLCAFEVHYAPAGPFVTAQYSFFIPVEDFSRTTNWMSMNRGPYDMLVHPNTGCVVLDHSDWAFWGGNRMPLHLAKDKDQAACARPGFMVDFSDEGNICPSVHGHRVSRSSVTSVASKITTTTPTMIIP